MVQGGFASNAVSKLIFQLGELFSFSAPILNVEVGLRKLLLENLHNRVSPRGPRHFMYRLNLFPAQLDRIVAAVHPLFRVDQPDPVGIPRRDCWPT